MANVLEKLAVTVEAAAVNRISEIKVQAKLARYRFFCMSNRHAFLANDAVDSAFCIFDRSQDSQTLKDISRS